jgi:hypothetical protein
MDGNDLADLRGGGHCKGVVDGSSEFQVKSYCEVGKNAMLFRVFDDRKREMVRSVGFDGLLRTPLIDELDNKFSMLLLTCLDPETMVFNLPNGDSMPITDIDAHFVLGIPFKGKEVCHDNSIDKDVVSHVLGKLSIAGHSASLSLEYLEWLLKKIMEKRSRRKKRWLSKLQ